MLESRPSAKLLCPRVFKGMLGFLAEQQVLFQHHTPKLLLLPEPALRHYVTGRAPSRTSTLMQHAAFV